MSKFLMAIIENETLVREEVVGFIPPKKLWPKNADGSFARRPLTEDLRPPDGYKPHLHLLKLSYTIAPESVVKAQIREDRADEEVRASLLKAASAHCEELITQGVHIPAIASMFKCDNGSIIRLKSLRDEVFDLETANQPVSFKFRTASGVTITITASAEVTALYTAVKDHVRTTLSRSAELAQRIDVMDHAKLWALDVTAPAHWQAGT